MMPPIIATVVTVLPSVSTAAIVPLKSTASIRGTSCWLPEPERERMAGGALPPCRPRTVRRRSAVCLTVDGTAIGPELERAQVVRCRAEIVDDE